MIEKTEFFLLLILCAKSFAASNFLWVRKFRLLQLLHWPLPIQHRQLGFFSKHAAFTAYTLLFPVISKVTPCTPSIS
jgi:hypothetical protein